MSASFLIMALVWSGLAAGFAECLTRGSAGPHFAQAVWRIAAGFMLLPWAGLVLSALFPAASIALPNLAPLPDFAIHDSALSGPLSALPLQPRAGPELSAILLAILLTGWIVRAIAIALSHARLAALQSASTPLETPHLVAEAGKWADALTLPYTPQLATLPGHHSPFVTGVFRRTVYLPEALKTRASAGLIIAHECIHISRGDLITRPMERAIADILWFSPFAWLARRRLDYYREAVCDRETVALTEAPIAYARALSEVARTLHHARPMPVAAFITPKKRKLLPMRISAILTPATATSKSRIGLGLAGALIAAPLAIAQGVSSPQADIAQSFSAPVITHPEAKITSHFGERPDPFNKGATRFHRGVDIGVPTGAPVQAPAGATVIFAGHKSEAYGNVVDLRLTDSGDVLRFSQLSEVAVQTGDTLRAGTRLGRVGQSGRATGPHLHMEYILPAATNAAEDVVYQNPADIDGLTLIDQH